MGRIGSFWSKAWIWNFRQWTAPQPYPGVEAETDDVLENSVVIDLAAVTVANLYVQGGMRVRHVAWFAVILAMYDALFSFVWPVTTLLGQRFLGWSLNPCVGFRWDLTNASIGLGDLLIYSLFVIAWYKAYGRVAARIAMVLAVVFGAVAPALSPLVFDIFTDARRDLFVPAQVAFGPVAFTCYLLFRRRSGPERTMVEFLASADARRRPRTPVLDRFVVPPSASGAPTEPGLPTEPRSPREVRPVTVAP